VLYCLILISDGIRDLKQTCILLVTRVTLSLITIFTLQSMFGFLKVGSSCLSYLNHC